jgi:hypothetical protein
MSKKGSDVPKPDTSKRTSTPLVSPKLSLALKEVEAALANMVLVINHNHEIFMETLTRIEANQPSSDLPDALTRIDQNLADLKSMKDEIVTAVVAVMQDMVSSSKTGSTEGT